MDIRIEIVRHRSVALSRRQIDAVVRDVEGTLKKFPKLKKLTALEGQDFRLDMQTIGSRVARIAHEVSFGARCVADTAGSELSWTPLPGVGNARLEGRLRLDGEGGSARLSLHVRGELHDVPVPLMYRLVAPAFIQGKFAALVDNYLERIVGATGSTAVRPPA